MGLLAPLYALAALAVAAPILFHLIRRQPRGQTEFSSLMFLQASPPRMTRRSRLDNLFLLLLRALALALIAIAFARPFMRSAELADVQVASREILLLIDTSGSMQRPDVWRAAIESAQQYVHGLSDSDLVGLATFDTSLQVRLPLPEANEFVESGQGQRSALLNDFPKLQPSYRGTRLAECLMAAADLLQERSTAAHAQERPRELVLISDLHEGSGIEALQGYAWPENVRLDIRRITPEKSGNARATLMQPDLSSGEVLADDSENSIRVRVENNQNSDQVDFQLQWLEQASVPPVRVQVPAGQARVVPVPLPPNLATTLVLSGDNAAFDNTLEIPRTAPRQERIGFVGQTRDKPEEDLFFFLNQIPFDTPVRQVTVQRLSAAELTAATTDESLAGLAIEAPLNNQMADALLKYVESGRPAVVVLARPLTSDQDAPPTTTETEQAITKLLNLEQPVSIREAEEAKFALWTEIDFRHPLFLPLADARFNDFGKVRFWSHRRLQLPVDSKRNNQPDGADQSHTGDGRPQSDYRILARFDDQSPALIHRRVNTGDLWLLMAGWQTTSSQLALSSKFVPLMFGMFDLQARSMAIDAVYEVGEIIPTSTVSQLALTTVDGRTIEVADENQLALEQPGLYWLSEDGKRRQVAVTIPLSESQLDPLDQERFLQYGVITGKSSSADELRNAARLSQINELEGRQKLWRWVLVGALAVLLLETLIAWRASMA